LISASRPQDIGAAVRGLRRELGLTQEALARKAETSLSTIQSTERGDFTGRPYKLPQIAKALGVTIAVLEGRGTAYTPTGAPLSELARELVRRTSSPAEALALLAEAMRDEMERSAGSTPTRQLDAG
jgi:transcriptional regulator with XRE-family HTH domain